MSANGMQGGAGVREPDPFDCQEFHELAMDYRGAHPIHAQGAYERLQAYCRKHAYWHGANVATNAHRAMSQTAAVSPRKCDLCEREACSFLVGGPDGDKAFCGYHDPCSWQATPSGRARVDTKGE